MSLLNKSVLDIDSLSENDVYSIFEKSQKIKNIYQKSSIKDQLRFKEQIFPQTKGKVISLAFFESSTRTRSSFEIASYRLGISVAAQSFTSSESSLSKGESLVDTVQNLCAMEPDLLVIRYNVDEKLNRFLENSLLPVINAGGGVASHPTQALLDSFTIKEELGEIKGQKIFIIGDIKHSRVAASNVKLLKKLGAEVALCGPDAMMSEAKFYDDCERMSLDEGLKWATVVMSLRIQQERHFDGCNDLSSEKKQYFEKYGINLKRIKKINGIFMHPGPFNDGVEVNSEIMKDSRCKILQQVTNGVYVRAGLLAEVLGLGI